MNTYTLAMQVTDRAWGTAADAGRAAVVAFAHLGYEARVTVLRGDVVVVEYSTANVITHEEWIADSTAARDAASAAADVYSAVARDPRGEFADAGV